MKTNDEIEMMEKEIIEDLKKTYPSLPLVVSVDCGNGWIHGEVKKYEDMLVWIANNALTDNKLYFYPFSEIERIWKDDIQNLESVKFAVGQF